MSIGEGKVTTTMPGILDRNAVGCNSVKCKYDVAGMYLDMQNRQVLYMYLAMQQCEAIQVHDVDPKQK